MYLYGGKFLQVISYFKKYFQKEINSNFIYFSTILGWRLVDCTWGAGRVNPRTKQFERNLNEHFFLADPEELIYTHFPYNV